VERGSSNGSAHRYYLMDLGQKVKERALEARKEKEATQGPEDAGWREFHATRLLAYFEVVALMQEQAQAFGIPLEDLGLEDLDPFRDLL
jgi:hypothetical protein